MAEEKQTACLSLPGWGIDGDLYERLCRHLGFTPSPDLYGKLSRYLLQTAATQPAPTGFARWLAELRPGRTAFGWLDIWTRLLMPASPWRYRLNAIIGIHECDPQGYREMMRGAGSGIKAWAAAISSAAALVLNLIPGFLWLCGQGCLYMVSRNTTQRERNHFEGATTLVTGASRGLGLAFVARLLSLGAYVIAVARDSAALQSLRDQAAEAGFGERLRVAAADVATPGAITEALRAAGIDGSRIDTAIINAGVKEGSAGPDAEEAVRRTFGVNVFGAMETAAALLPAWRARGKGRFIFISSLGRWHGMGMTGAYNASKAALSVLAESMAMDLRTEGFRSVQITIVEPGLIRTAMIGQGILQKLLSVDKETAARRILQSAAKGRSTCRFPFVFVVLTAVIAVLPLALRVRILARVKSGR
jgi:NAD(P)-dependent dehydrogenase (short-subunit alcohol dehydrogenase family)